MENSFESELLSFGEWVQQRRQAMGLTRADLAKEEGCAAVTIKKIEREERKPSQQIAELLADNLAIPDALRTEFIRMSREDFLPFPKHSPEILRIPPSLQKNTRLTNQNPSLFVERQAEMAWLDTHLSQALAGNGLPVFILGDFRKWEDHLDGRICSPRPASLSRSARRRRPLQCTVWDGRSLSSISGYPGSAYW